ncbi:MAG: response regulator transcription factor [Burkholderiaceae bacterium]|nr:response regulator transcription factor [Burkholderiaceae bacterium]
MASVALTASRAAVFEILIVEDHPMMIRSITASLEALQPDAHKSGRIVTVGSLEQAKKRLLRRVKPGLVISDLNLPDSTGLDTLRALRVVAPNVPVVVFSAVDDESTEQAALDLGAQAFVSKSALPQNFAQKIRPFLLCLEHAREPGHVAPALAVAGETQHPVSMLTERQRTVLAEVSNGYCNSEIALRLKIGEQTVRTHLAGIFQRLGVQNRTQASIQYAAWAKEHDLLA